MQRRVARYFCFRFDVDTHRCIREGVPNLIELATPLEARFTFFVNMGRAVSRPRALRRRLRDREGDEEVAAKLSPRHKLGPWGSLVAAVLNPVVGQGSPRILRELLAHGHEIGLHGGANHAIWQAEAEQWPRARVRTEIVGALRRMESLAGHRPEGFASPGWNTPDELGPVLQELGFAYLADHHGSHHPPVSTVEAAPELVSVRTDLVGEPGGVAYLEHLRARGLGEQAILADFRDRLRSADRLAVVYDHPYYAGVQQLDLIAALVRAARDLGFEVITLGEAVDRLRPDAEPKGRSA